MSETPTTPAPELLSAERLAEIAAQLALPRARNAYVTEYGLAADVVEELLDHISAQTSVLQAAESALAKSSASEKWLNESLDQKMEEAENADYHEACATESRDMWQERAKAAEARAAEAEAQVAMLKTEMAEQERELSYERQMRQQTLAAFYHAVRVKEQTAELAEQQGRADCHCSARSENECTCHA